MIDQLARYTGLSKTYIDESNLRIDESHFTKELMRDKRQDHRPARQPLYRHIDAPPSHETASFDPSMSAIRPPYTAMFNQYVRSELGLQVRSWSITSWAAASVSTNGIGAFSAAASLTPLRSLKDAFDKNPFMKLFVGSGYFDLATPYFATQYTLNHMGLDAGPARAVTLGYYGAGHMMYIQDSVAG